MPSFLPTNSAVCVWPHCGRDIIIEPVPLHVPREPGDGMNMFSRTDFDDHAHAARVALTGAERRELRELAKARFLTTRRGVVWEAICGECGETFNPCDENDTEHGERENGEPCGGQGEITGRWMPPRVSRTA